MTHQIGILPPFTGDKIRLNLITCNGSIVANMHVEVIAVRYERGSYESTDLLLKQIKDETQIRWCKRKDILTYTLLN